ncbi:MAG: methyltransferase domain-containing protein [Ilumatobacteraceae bacterium]
MADVDRQAVAARAEEYYDSDDADAFYHTVWGGEDIHIGLYEQGDSIAAASRRTVEAMAERVLPLGPDTRVLDLGAGYGGSARLLAAQFGCPVTCLNISEVQNERNREMNAEQGLDGLISVSHGSFEDVPAEADSFEVVWSQDSFLHAGDRALVLDEIARVLVPGGRVVFTDPMQGDDVSPSSIQPILDRIHLASLGSPGFYEREMANRGFQDIGFDNLTHQLRNHYATVREELTSLSAAGKLPASSEYVDRMVTGLGHWVDGADQGKLRWGIIHARLGAT